MARQTCLRNVWRIDGPYIKSSCAAQRPCGRAAELWHALAISDGELSKNLERLDAKYCASVRQGQAAD